MVQISDFTIHRLCYNFVWFLSFWIFVSEKWDIKHLCNNKTLVLGKIRLIWRKILNNCWRFLVHDLNSMKGEYNVSSAGLRLENMCQALVVWGIWIGCGWWHKSTWRSATVSGGAISNKCYREYGCKDTKDLMLNLDVKVFLVSPVFLFTPSSFLLVLFSSCISSRLAISQKAEHWYQRETLALPSQKSSPFNYILLLAVPIQVTPRYMILKGRFVSNFIWSSDVAQMQSVLYNPGNCEQIYVEERELPCHIIKMWQGVWQVAQHFISLGVGRNYVSVKLLWTVLFEKWD